MLNNCRTKEIDKKCQWTTFTKVGSRNRMVTSLPICHNPLVTKTISGRNLDNHTALKNSQTVEMNGYHIRTQNNNIRSAYKNSDTISAKWHYKPSIPPPVRIFETSVTRPCGTRPHSSTVYQNLQYGRLQYDVKKNIIN
jgi:hypothetical protein